MEKRKWSNSSWNLLPLGPPFNTSVASISVANPRISEFSSLTPEVITAQMRRFPVVLLAESWLNQLPLVVSL